ncbi:MAG: prepilin-type N-terminal cleavage/methylation domain-containing protein [Armatimonadetes bacterium]|nr:prepilin-type N-terminal cleavage/methylation domain-containing protein [Armatimonadota bacterium]
MIKRPRGRRAFTLVEIMIVILIIGILLTIAVPYYAQVRLRTWTHACLENQVKIDQAKQLWQMEEGMGPTDTPVMTDLVPKYLKREPKCPTHGTYTIGNCSEPATCDQHARGSNSG